MIDVRPKWIKLREPEKAHLHPLRDVCVQHEMDPPMGFRDLLEKRNVARYQAY